MESEIQVHNKLKFVLQLTQTPQWSGHTADWRREINTRSDFHIKIPMREVKVSRCTSLTSHKFVSSLWLSLAHVSLDLKTLKRHFVWHRQTSPAANRENVDELYIGGNWIQYHFIINVRIQPSHCIQMFFFLAQRWFMCSLQQPPLWPFPSHLCSHFELWISTYKRFFWWSEIKTFQIAKYFLFRPFHWHLIRLNVLHYEPNESYWKFSLRELS